MATPTAGQVRDRLREYYKDRGWNEEKVSTMSSGQAYAIYCSYQKKGWPLGDVVQQQVALIPEVDKVPKSRSKKKALVIPGQLALI